jgi:hypothetical protein
MYTIPRVASNLKVSVFFLLQLNRTCMQWVLRMTLVDKELYMNKLRECLFELIWAFHRNKPLNRIKRVGCVADFPKAKAANTHCCRSSHLRKTAIPGYVLLGPASTRTAASAYDRPARCTASLYKEHLVVVRTCFYFRILKYGEAQKKGCQEKKRSREKILLSKARKHEAFR